MWTAHLVPLGYGRHFPPNASGAKPDSGRNEGEVPARRERGANLLNAPTLPAGAADGRENPLSLGGAKGWLMRRTIRQAAGLGKHATRHFGRENGGSE